MNIPSIETPHLLLRGWTPDDAGALFDVLQEEDILRYFPNAAPPSREKVGNYISRQLANWEQFSYGHWAIVMREDDQVAGWCGLEHLAELNETEVAYLLSKRVWGRGFATEAARAAVRFGFETSGLEYIIGLVHPENAGSVRVLEKCGFHFTDRITLWGLEMSRYHVNHAVFETNRLSQGHQIAAPKDLSLP